LCSEKDLLVLVVTGDGCSFVVWSLDVVLVVVLVFGCWLLVIYGFGFVWGRRRKKTEGRRRRKRKIQFRNLTAIIIILF